MQKSVNFAFESQLAEIKVLTDSLAQGEEEIIALDKYPRKEKL